MFDCTPFLFQLTLLMRGATQGAAGVDALLKFQLTLLMRGATIWSRNTKSSAVFQLTLLMRGATRSSCGFGDSISFNSRSSCEERLSRSLWVSNNNCFNSRSSCEERQQNIVTIIARLSIYSKCENHTGLYCPISRVFSYPFSRERPIQLRITIGSRNEYHWITTF